MANSPESLAVSLSSSLPAIALSEGDIMRAGDAIVTVLIDRLKAGYDIDGRQLAMAAASAFGLDYDPRG